MATVRNQTAASNPQDGHMSADADVPHGDVSKPQILIIRDDSAKLRLCIVRKASSRQLAQVRVSKPVYHDLPAGCVRRNRQGFGISVACPHLVCLPLPLTP